MLLPVCSCCCCPWRRARASRAAPISARTRPPALLAGWCHATVGTAHVRHLRGARAAAAAPTAPRAWAAAPRRYLRAPPAWRVPRWAGRSAPRTPHRGGVARASTARPAAELRGHGGLQRVQRLVQRIPAARRSLRPGLRGRAGRKVKFTGLPLLGGLSADGRAPDGAPPGRRLVPPCPAPLCRAPLWTAASGCVVSGRLRCIGNPYVRQRVAGEAHRPTRPGAPEAPLLPETTRRRGALLCRCASRPGCV